MEISYGPFETVLDLPAGYDLTRAKAIYVNGFLRVDVPPVQQPQAKTTKVPISEGDMIAQVFRRAAKVQTAGRRR